MANILVIEDDEMIRQLLLRRLGRAGYEVQTASDGETGINLALGGQAALILLDLRLPDMTGYEVATRIRREAKRQTPIIAVSASCTDADRKHAIQCGCNAFHAKPMDWGKLLEQIEKLLVPA